MSIRASRAACAAFLFVASLAAHVPIARAYDAASSFAPSSNPGAVWSYGWTPTRGGAFTLFAAHGTAGGLDYWQYATNQTRVEHNGSSVGVLVGTNVYTPANGLNLRPGNNGELAVVRWTSPVAGTYTVNARFVQRAYPSVQSTQEVYVLTGAAVLFDRLISMPLGVNAAAVTATLVLNAGDVLDFAVGPADYDNSFDTVGLDATVNLEPPAPGLAGPVFRLGGQRFAACRWGAVGTTSAFESIAYDPLNKRLASEGKLRDRCGNSISAGPDEQPGLAWDSRTSTYWQITNDRRVRRWSAAGALLDTVFTIPATFAVPVSGADTLDSPRGIATDSGFVYVVDAGLNPGTPSSCEWFKFTRAGAPVKSSRSTNFVANLDLDPDALVDDICYVPFASPVLPGRLLIALEHSGIQVIDTDGNFVEKFRWSQQFLPGARPLSAFSGIAIDPVAGNLYLADNGTGAAMVLTRLASPAATSYVLATVGTSGSEIGATLKLPNPGCDLRLWNGYALSPTSSGNLFGLAYRPANNSVYMLDYSGGDLWRFEPRLGAASRVGPTGISSAWGIAFDAERDLLYVAVGYTPSRILAIDPASGASYGLPQPVGFPIGSSADLAWDPVDKKIYAVDQSVAPPRLIRIDRDSGTGASVGPTRPASGLDYDAASGRLIGDNSARIVWSIDPATGVGDTLAVVPVGAGWEGVAVIPVPVNPALLAVGGDAVPVPGTLLRAFPNPARAGAQMEFTMPVTAAVTMGIYDVAGRRVRELVRGVLDAGVHRVGWDGLDGDRQRAADGVYFVRLELPGRTLVARLVTLR